MKAEVIREGDNDEFYIDEGCYITEIYNSAADPELSIARARVPVGVTTAWHRLVATAERYSILQGSGKVELEGRAPQTVTVGDLVVIPPMCAQRIRNCGDENLIFLAICTPRFLQQNYQDIVME